jgi:hypothetical protein
MTSTADIESIAHVRAPQCSHCRLPGVSQPTSVGNKSSIPGCILIPSYLNAKRQTAIAIREQFISLQLHRVASRARWARAHWQRSLTARDRRFSRAVLTPYRH